MFRIIKAKGKKEAMGYASYGEFAFGFYEEVIAHLPFVSSVHNIWRAKQLFHLNYGFSNFRQGFIFFALYSYILRLIKTEISQHTLQDARLSRG